MAHKTSREVCVKARSPPASLAVISQATRLCNCKMAYLKTNSLISGTSCELPYTNFKIYFKKELMEGFKAASLV